MKPVPPRPLPALGAALCTLAGAGCMVGPDYGRPEAPVNDAWLEQQATDAAAPLDVQWWETFNDPTLTALVQMALRQNLTIRVAGLRVLEARAARGIAVGEFFPQLQEAFGSVDADRLSEAEAFPGADQSLWTSSLGLQAAWELDFWGRFRRGIEAADAEVLRSVAEYDTVLVSLAADVATAYILIRSLQERLDYARANADLQAETLSLTEARFLAGAVSELDVSTARATLANTLARIPDLETSLRRAELALCVLLGRTPSQLESELAPADGRGPLVPEAPASIATGVPAHLLRRRPDVRSAERAAAAESARIGQAVSDLYPRISIAGATGFVSNSADDRDLGNIFDSDSFSGFIGLRVTWPILNYGRIQSNIRVRDARFEQAVAAYQDTVLRAASEVEAGLTDFLNARERTTHLAVSVASSQRSVELSLIQYRAGAADFIRVNDAQTVLVEAQDTLVAARAAIALGAVLTYRALGGGWEIRQGQEFIDPATQERMQRRTDWGDVMGAGWETGKDRGFPRPRQDADPAGDDQ